MQQYFEPLRQFIEIEKTQGASYPNALFAFPDKEPRNICVYKKEKKAFMIYDIYLNRYTRKISKPIEQGEGKFDSTSFDIDPKCKVLIFAQGKSIQLMST